MPDILIQPNADADDDLTNGVVINDATLPLSNQSASGLGLTLGTTYKARVLGDPETFSVTNVPSQMSAPTLAVDSDTQITATLAADPADGGSAITSYDIRYSTDQTTWTTLTGITSPVAITSLAAETLHYVQSRAVNAIGAGAWSSSASATTDAAPVGVDPEAGLTLDTSFPAGVIAGGEMPPANRSQPVVMACDFTGLDGSSGGFIAEHGGGGTGMFVGFDLSGHFIVRCGDGGVGFPAGCAYIEMTSGQPSGDGTLVWEFNPSTGGVRAWWNGALIGTPAGSFSGDWTGGDGGCFMGSDHGSSQAGDYGLSAPVGGTAPTLRVYFNQTSSA